VTVGGDSFEDQLDENRFAKSNPLLRQRTVQSTCRVLFANTRRMAQRLRDLSQTLLSFPDGTVWVGCGANFKPTCAGEASHAIRSTGKIGKISQVPRLNIRY